MSLHGIRIAAALGSLALIAAGPVPAAPAPAADVFALYRAPASAVTENFLALMREHAGAAA